MLGTVLQKSMFPFSREQNSQCFLLMNRPSAEKETAQALQQYSCQYIQQYERIRKERESFGTEHRRYSQSISINGLILQMAENS